MIQLKISHSIGRWQIMSTKVDLNWNFPGHSKPCVWRKSVLPTWRSRWLWWRWSWWRLKYLTYMLNKEEETLLIMYSFIENFTCFSLACSAGVLSGCSIIPIAPPLPSPSFWLLLTPLVQISFSPQSCTAWKKSMAVTYQIMTFLVVLFVSHN